MKVAHVPFWNIWVMMLNNLVSGYFDFAEFQAMKA